MSAAQTFLHAAPAPLGRVAITTDDGALVALHVRTRRTAPGAPPTGLAAEVARQLDAYARGERTGFDLPLRFGGTPFEQAVWAQLARIPYGETRTYGEIAAAIGEPGAARAVGRANARNPIAVVVPCHRVIGANGSLTGYAGGLDLKRDLLALEAGAMVLA